MLVADLKQGDKLYDTQDRRVRFYTYLCVQPKGKGAYHILIDENEKPFRVHREELEKICNKNLTSYQEAKMALAAELEAIAKELREEPVSLG